MRPALALALATSLLATPGLAQCPAPGDMSKGIALQTRSERGQIDQYVFRKASGSSVTQTKKSNWRGTSNTTRTKMTHGLIPTDLKVTASTRKKPILKDTRYSYSPSGIGAIEIKPRSLFSVRQTSKASDGFTKVSTLTYQAASPRQKRIGGCSVSVLPITLTEDWDGAITTHKISFLQDFGFGVTTEIKYPGRTYKLDITQIAAR